MGFVCNSVSRWGSLGATRPGWVECVAPSPDPAVFDDAYRRPSELMRRPNNGFESGKTIAVNVTNGRSYHAWQRARGTTIRTGTCSATLSGSFVSEGKHMRIDGTTNGQTLTGEYRTRRCKYTYRPDRT